MDNITLDNVLKQEGHEDYVEYFVFPPHVASKNTHEELLEYNAAIQSLTQGHIWQKDSILLNQDNALSDLETKTVGENTVPRYYFHGTTMFGDNIEDEWFVTWVLLQLTTQFPGCVVRVIDNDGEFLLIEAADHLPSWAESDSACQQRVYLCNGKVHLIPKFNKKSAALKHLPKGTPSMLAAVKAVRDHPEITLASESINQCIKNRIGEYPEKLRRNFHHVNLVLPPKLSTVLNKYPELVAPAVNAFYYRDPMELQASRLMKNFKPGDCLVKSRVRFTKCLYAMLSKQEFFPDPKTGWGFPRPSSSEFKAHSLGAKLTIGFEILLSKTSVEFPLEHDVKDSESSPNWLIYLSSLKKHGYFKGCIEGSKPYQELEAKAAIFYQDSIIGQSNKNKLSEATSFLKKLKNLVQTVVVDLESLKKEAHNLQPDDDDSWMDISPENLEVMLQKQFLSGGGSFSSPKPEDIPTKLKEFMGKMAELEGVDLPSSSETKHSEQNPSRSLPDDVALDPLDFRADDFVSAMDKLLTDLGMPDKDWDESDDEDISYSEEEAMNEIMNQHKFKKDSKLFQLMNQMDEELAQTDVAKTFNSQDRDNDDDEFGDVEEFEPVNIDINALQNMIKSFQSQEFPTGPSANLLKSVGFDISQAAASKSSSGTGKTSFKKN